ncbi:hypothetical protein LJR219_004037 [Phenylobacterium sp. LjRoot219]|uniref:hypothetical protein n=1 Tax=Phenylobacterium sp. LjRoot219 TaxID=3342283 RepID=UPI003ECCDA3E
MNGAYTLTLLRDGPRAEWSRVLPFPNDGQAITAAGRIAETEGRRSPEPVSLMVGRNLDEGHVEWLGGWDWENDALWWDALDEPL